MRNTALIYLAPLLAGLMGSAEAKPVKGEICPTKVSGLVNKCNPGKKCVLHLERGDVLTDIKYFGSRKCDKKTGFTKVEVSGVDEKGVVLKVKGLQIFPRIKKDRFRVNYDIRKQSEMVKALGMEARKTGNPKVARVIFNR